MNTVMYSILAVWCVGLVKSNGVVESVQLPHERKTPGNVEYSPNSNPNRPDDVRITAKRHAQDKEQWDLYRSFDFHEPSEVVQYAAEDVASRMKREVLHSVSNSKHEAMHSRLESIESHFEVGSLSRYLTVSTHFETRDNTPLHSLSQS